MYDITDGVPQGSILGPLLLIIYIADIDQCCKKGISFGFADDTTILIQNNNFEDLYIDTYDQINSICQWLVANKVSINLSKSNYVLFRNKRNINMENEIPQLIVHGVEIKRVEYEKFLGVDI